MSLSLSKQEGRVRHRNPTGSPRGRSSLFLFTYLGELFSLGSPPYLRYTIVSSTWRLFSSFPNFLFFVLGRIEPTTLYHVDGDLIGLAKVTGRYCPRRIFVSFFPFYGWSSHHPPLADSLGPSRVITDVAMLTEGTALDGHSWDLPRSVGGLQNREQLHAVLPVLLCCAPVGGRSAAAASKGSHRSIDRRSSGRPLRPPSVARPCTKKKSVSLGPPEKESNCYNNELRKSVETPPGQTKISCDSCVFAQKEIFTIVVDLYFIQQLISVVSELLL